jgi:vacuolar-type H+-ATPase subunit I/STV1
MHPVIQKTLGGLSPQYFFRQFFFGLVVAAFVFFMSTQGGRSMPAGMLLFIVANTLLYPYSRFVYESIVGFIMGQNVFFVNAISMLISKFVSMAMCWAFALFVAPIGLAYLYYHHSKAER